MQGDINEIAEAMKGCGNPNEYRRIQCVYLALLHPQMSAKEISGITLYSERRVKEIHAKYRIDGLKGLEDLRGGRYRQYLSVEEEAEFLKPFIEQSKTGSIVVI